MSSSRSTSWTCSHAQLHQTPAAALSQHVMMVSSAAVCPWALTPAAPCHCAPPLLPSTPRDSYTHQRRPVQTDSVDTKKAQASASWLPAACRPLPSQVQASIRLVCLSSHSLTFASTWLSSHTSYLRRLTLAAEELVLPSAALLCPP